MVHHGAGLRRLTKDDKLAEQLGADYAAASIGEADRAMLRYADKLTRTPAKMTQDDVDALRAVGFSGAAVLDCELRRGGPSYTIDTVSELASKYPAAALKLAMGWDVYESFRDWRGAEALLELASLLVVSRAGSPAPTGRKSDDWLAGLPSLWRGKLRMGANGNVRDEIVCDKQGRVILEFLNLKLPRVSSSQIRAKRDLSRVPAGARELLQAYWRQSG